MSRPAPLGGRRWFMLDEQGRRCEVLYRSGARFVSRKGAGLTYRSQSLSKLDRLISERNSLRARLEGSHARGPARGRNRHALIKRLAVKEEYLEIFGQGLVQQDLTKRSNATARAVRSKERLERARAQIERNRTISSEKVIEAFEDPLNKTNLKIRARAINQKLLSEDDGEVRPRELSLRLLHRLGYLQPGKLTGYQIGWPKKWLKGCCLYILFDLRRRGRWSATVVMERGDSASAQHFGIAKVRGKFGKANYVFEDPVTGAQTGRLALKRGQMKMVETARPARSSTGLVDKVHAMIDPPELASRDFELPNINS